MSATLPSSRTPTLREGDEGGGVERGPHLYLVLNCDRPLAASYRFCLRDCDGVTLGRGEAVELEARREGKGRRLLITLSDRWMSSTHAELVRAGSAWVLVDKQSKNHTHHNGRVVAQAALSDGDVIEVGRSFLLFRADQPCHACAAPARKEVGASLDDLLPPTLAPALEKALLRLLSVARDSPASILIRGETGTGKELIARAVHKLAKRPGEFVAVNCGELAEGVVESELLGHARGAFSGAHCERIGIVRTADRGTLFLDEIGDLRVDSQAVLLRVLQESEVRPVGGRRPVPVDLRVVSATHHDIERLLARGRFRADLHMRLAAFTVALLPLRERREDLGLVFGTLLLRHARSGAPDVTITRELARALFSYRWPGNVRELEQYLVAALPLARGRAIGIQDMPALAAVEVLRETAAGVTVPQVEPPPVDGEGGEPRRGEQLVALLAMHKGNVAAVARTMGCSRAQVHRWLKFHRLNVDDYRH